MRSLYLTAILPPSEAANRIHQLRIECSEKYQVYKALRPPVHITLYKPVWLPQSDETPLLAAMRSVAEEHAPFQQEVKDFAKFGKRVMYLEAIANPRILALQRQIAQVFREKSFDRDARETESYHPHFTLAFRDVTPEKFDEMWKEYRDRRFQMHFPVNDFSILKHDGTKWNVVETIPLIGKS